MRAVYFLALLNFVQNPVGPGMECRVPESFNILTYKRFSVPFEVNPRLRLLATRRKLQELS